MNRGKVGVLAAIGVGLFVASSAGGSDDDGENDIDKEAGEGKARCGICGKIVAAQGLSGHKRFAHDDEKQ